jgi:hypothetical protein
MKYSVLIFLLLFQPELLGQSTFNTSYMDNELNSSGLQVFEYEDFLYVVSRGLKVDEGVELITTIRKLDMNGMELNSIELSNSGSGINTFLYGCVMLSNGEIVIASATAIENVPHLIVQKISSELVLNPNFNIMASPYNPEMTNDWNALILPSAIIADADDNIYLAVSVGDSEIAGLDVLFCKYNSELQLIWDFLHVENQEQIVYSLAYAENTLFSVQIGEYSSNENTLTKELIKIKEDEFGIPFVSSNTVIDFAQANSVFENLVEEDGFVLIGTRIDELALENSPIVFKLNMDGLYQWYSPPSLPFSEENQAYYGVEHAHGGGYVCVGMEVEFGGNNEGWSYDMDRFGNLTKHSDVGTIEWHRRYSLIESCDELHSFSDIIRTESGYLIVGTRADYCFDETWEASEPRERIWLIKTDECGCIVPGCGEKDCYIGLDEEKPEHLNVLLYPNPSSDYCSIYIPEGYRSNQLQIFNSLGQLVLKRNGLKDDTTYIIPVSSWETGIYILNLLSESNFVETHKIEVLHR